ncbi:MAG: D-cysteine desulfhydrase family protein, partial [candidate division NC10 bacterium]
LATGGNKARKLEYLLGAARQRGADVLITEGGMQSNHCRQTAAAAVRCGIPCVLVLSRGQHAEVTGNLLLDQLLGARIVLVDSGAERRPMMERLAAEARGQGQRPYLIPTGGSNGVGAVGYVQALHELETQARARGINVDACVFCSGSGGTHGGLVAGAKLSHSKARLVGISDGEPRASLVEMVCRVASEAGEVLGAPLSVAAGEIEAHDDYAREGYGVPNQGMIEAMRLVARTEGIVLDPVYTGKAMAGLIDLVKQGAFTAGQTVVFIHTGGVAGLFAYRDGLAEDLR